MTGEQWRGWRSVTAAGLCGLEGSPRHSLKLIEYVPSRKATLHPHSAKWRAHTSCKVEHYHLVYAQKSMEAHKHSLEHLHTCREQGSELLN